MTRLSRILPLLWPLVAASTAQAEVSERAYDRSIDLIQRLYLHPDDIDSASLLHAAARSVSDDIDWLLVEPAGDSVHLRHGSGQPIGSVSVANLDTLPDALRALEQVVRDSGYPLRDDFDLRLSIVQGLTNALDKHSRVLEGDGLERFDVRLKGTLVGIGATLALRDGKLTIGDILPDGPADHSELRVGDIIERIDDHATTNITLREATRRIRGDLATDVRLDILRGEERLQLVLTRAEVVVPNVNHRVLEGNVGYVAITHFSQRTVLNLDASLAKLREQGALSRGLVIDLRGNTGGSMKEAARSADRFVKSGTLLRTVGPYGGQVQNLQSQMEAVEDEDILDIPIALLIDDRTASGSEILAGALVELDRAVTVGTRSYGKGTVQKIYNLDASSRLKLTVAQYLLANDRAIDGAGLVPDVVTRPIDLDSYGARFRSWGPEETGTTLQAIVPTIQESKSWRDQEHPSMDGPLELARRAVSTAAAPTRESTLEALRQAAAELRLQEEAHLTEALAAHDVDWSIPTSAPTATPSQLPILVLTSRPDPDHADAILVQATVTNPGEHPLHRVLAQLRAPNYSVWDGLIVPVGRVDPGTTVVGQVRIPLRPGVLPREDEVQGTLHALELDPGPTSTAVLSAQSGAIPEVSARAHLIREGMNSRAAIEVHNRGRAGLVGVDVHFANPEDADVELLEEGSRIPLILGGQARETQLGIRLGDEPPDSLPLRLELESEHYGDLASWSFALPTDGSAVALQPPSIRTPSRPTSAPVGELLLTVDLEDDVGIDHAVAWLNGEKVGWWGDAAAKQELRLPLLLQPGENTVLLRAQDTQGLKTYHRVVIRGEVTATVDATPE